MPISAAVQYLQYTVTGLPAATVLTPYNMYPTSVYNQ
jgi:hypothetical protein